MRRAFESCGCAQSINGATDAHKRGGIESIEDKRGSRHTTRDFDTFLLLATSSSDFLFKFKLRIAPQPVSQDTNVCVFKTLCYICPDPVYSTTMSHDKHTTQQNSRVTKHTTTTATIPAHGKIAVSLEGKIFKTEF